MVMQHIDFTRVVNELYLSALLEELVEKELLTVEQKEIIDTEQIIAFFDTELGSRLQRARKIRRETPFSVAVKASEIYADWSGEDEPILVQGIIDCLFEDELGTVLLDYKTDSITERFKGGFEEAKPVLAKRYRVQIDLYVKAVESILKRHIDQKYLFFFDGGHVLEMN